MFSHVHKVWFNRRRIITLTLYISMPSKKRILSIPYFFSLGARMRTAGAGGYRYTGYGRPAGPVCPCFFLLSFSSLIKKIYVYTCTSCTQRSKVAVRLYQISLVPRPFGGAHAQERMIKRERREFGRLCEQAIKNSPSTRPLFYRSLFMSAVQPKSESSFLLNTAVRIYSAHEYPLFFAPPIN